MNINNVTEFRNFINGNGLRGLHPTIDGTANCIGEYERGCNCWNAGDRDRLMQNCKDQYIQSMSPIQSTYRAHFLVHTTDQNLTFYLDGRIIGSIRR